MDTVWEKIKEQEQKQRNHLGGIATVQDGGDNGLHSSAKIGRDFSEHGPLR